MIDPYANLTAAADLIEAANVSLEEKLKAKSWNDMDDTNDMAKTARRALALLEKTYEHLEDHARIAGTAERKELAAAR
jgi:hypothetical protein